jgi:hypothetical protein
MDANSVERAMRHIPGVAEGGKNEGSHSSAGLWKPKDDDQLRALAASGESSFDWTATPSQSCGDKAHGTKSLWQH